MPLTSLSALTGAIAALLALGACASSSPHQNFRAAMHGEVGKHAHAFDAYTSHYGRWRMSVRELPNGNTEEEYPTGRRHRCRVFFEIDKDTRVIVGWRFEGAQDDCIRIR